MTFYLAQGNAPVGVGRDPLYSHEWARLRHHAGPESGVEGGWDLPNPVAVRCVVCSPGHGPVACAPAPLGLVDALASGPGTTPLSWFDRLSKVPRYES